MSNRDSDTHRPDPPHHRSYAHLRTAQSFLAKGDPAAARGEYEKIAADAAHPEVHRYEATECINEIDRVQQGLPARDPSASRTTVAPVAPGIEFFVALDGMDTNPGTKDQPFATLTRARDAVRALKTEGLPSGGVAVTLTPGEYRVSETLDLTAEDGGTEASPVVYRAEDPGTVVLYGGARLRMFTLVDDPVILARLPEESRGKVYQCDLKAQGITDYPPLKVRGKLVGLDQPAGPPTIELYCDGKPMTLARWPNEGFVGIRRLLEPGEKGRQPSVFEYDSDRHARWTEAEDAWLFGYFKWLWADSTIPVGSIDPAARTLTTAEGYDYSGGMDTKEGIAYYAFNLLEELDCPGEWYLDRASGILYFWPPADPAAATIEIGQLSKPMITVADAAHVRVEGLRFDLSRDSCMTVTDSEHCLIAGCTVKRFAGNGISIHGGTNCGILGCDISMLGRRGTEVIGGDRVTLTPGGHFVENCQIHDFGRIDRTYTPAIQLEGVGNRVAHNLLYDCPSSVLRIEGNDHIIECNETHSSVRESDDQGSMELFFNPTYRGIVFRYNLFHHNGKTGTEHQVHGQAAIRLDDAISGVLIYGNVFYRSANGRFGAVQINSGRDNTIYNNLFAECDHGVTGGWDPANLGWTSIRDGTARSDYYMGDLYVSRYPAMATMMDDAGINNIWRNLFFRCGAVLNRDPALFDMLANGECDDDPGFADVAERDFSLPRDTPLSGSVAFRPIPIDEIGLYADRYRAS